MVCRDILTHLIGAILNGVALPCLVSPYESCGGCGTEQGSAEGAAVCRDLVCQAVNQPHCMVCTWFSVTPADLAAGLGLVSDQKILLILLLAVDKS